MDTKKQKAGRKGGRATVERHGRQYMSEIGRRGAATTWERYAIMPVDSSGYALVERATGKVRAIWCTPWIVLPLVVLSMLLAGCDAWGFQPLPTATRAAAATETPSASPAPSTPAARPSPTTTPPRAATCTVSNTGGDVLNVRSCAGMSCPIIGGLLPGQRVLVISAGDEWLFISAGDFAGFVAALYCEGTWK